MSDRLNELVIGVQKTRSLQMMRWLLLGLLSVFAIWGACFIAYSALDLVFKFPVVGRLAMFAMTIGALWFAIKKLAVNPLRAERPDQDIAADVEAVQPGLEASLSTSIEFGEDGEKIERLSSKPIVDRLIDQAADRVSSESYEQAVDWAWPRRIGVAMLLVIILVGAGFAFAPTVLVPALLRFIVPFANVEPPTLAHVDNVTPGDKEVPFRTKIDVRAEVSGFRPESVVLHYKRFGKDWRAEEMRQIEDGRYGYAFRDVKEDFEYYIQARDHESQHFNVSVFVEPSIETMSATLIYPEYTGMAPVKKNKAGDIRALAGTRVKLELRTNIPVREGELMLKSGETIRLSKKEPQVLRGEFKVQQNDHYGIKLYDRKGRSNVNILWHAITAMDDETPRIKITSPDPDMMAEINQQLKIRMQAEDDFGLTELGLATYVLGEEEIRETVKELDPPLKKTRSQYDIDFELMTLPKGAIIAYYAYALDNDTVNGPKEGVSILQFVRFYEKEGLANEDSLQNEQQQQGRQAQQQLLANLEKMIGEQIKVVANTFRIDNIETSKRNAANKKTLAGMAKKEGQLSSQVEQLADAMEEALRAEGITEMPEVDALREAISPLENAGWYLKYYSTDDGLTSGKDALHKMSKARRLVQSMQNQQGRQAAAMMALSQQKNQKKQQQQNRQQQMQQMAKEMPKMLERQEKAKRELEQLAKQEERERVRDETEQPDNWQKYQKREEIRDELNELLNESYDMARRMQEQSEQERKMSERAAERMKKALEETYQTQRSLSQRKYKDAFDHAKQAERNMKDAERSLHNALRRDLSDAMESASKRARQLAERQEDLQRQTQQMAQAERQESGERQAQQQSQQQQGQQQSKQQGQQQSKQQGQQQSKQQGQQQSQQEGQQQSKQQGQQQSQQQGQQQSQQQGQQKSQQQGQQSSQSQSAQSQQSSQSQQSAQARAQGQKSQSQQQASSSQQGQQQSQQQAQGGQKSENKDQQSRQAQSGQKPSDQQQGSGSAPTMSPEELQKQEQQQSGQGARQLAREQKELEKDARSLSSELQELAERAAEANRTKDQETLAKAAEKIESGPIGKALQEAAEKLESDKPSEAVPHQEEARKGLMGLRSQLDEAVARAKMEDDEKLRKMLEKTEQLADAQRKLNTQAMRGQSEPDELNKEQQALASQAGQLAKQSEKMNTLADAGLDKETKEAFDAAAKEMKQNQNALLDKDAEESKFHGEEALRQVEAAAENLRLARDRSLGKRLAKAADQAKAAVEQQRRSEDSLRSAAEDTPQGERVPQWQQKSMAETQKDAVERANELASTMETLNKIAKRVEPWVGDEIKKTLDELKDGPLPEMKDLSDNLQPKSAKGMQPSEARDKQEKAAQLAQALTGIQEQLESIKKDYLSTPLERLQAAKNDVTETLKELEKAEQQLQQAANKSPEAVQDLQKKLEQAQKNLDKLSQQLARQQGQNQSSSEQQNLQKAEGKMNAARQAMSSKETQEAKGHLTAAREHLQLAREGILERIKRILQKRNIKEPGSELVPDEYQELVKRYYRVLSEER